MGLSHGIPAPGVIAWHPLGRAISMARETKKEEARAGRKGGEASHGGGRPKVAKTNG